MSPQKGNRDGLWLLRVKITRFGKPHKHITATQLLASIRVNYRMYPPPPTSKEIQIAQGRAGQGNAVDGDGYASKNLKPQLLIRNLLFHQHPGSGCQPSTNSLKRSWKMEMSLWVWEDVLVVLDIIFTLQCLVEILLK